MPWSLALGLQVFTLPARGRGGSVPPGGCVAGCRPEAISLRSWARSCSEKERSRFSTTSPQGDSSSCRHTDKALHWPRCSQCLAIPDQSTGPRGAAGPLTPWAVLCPPLALPSTGKFVASALMTKPFPEIFGKSWGDSAGEGRAHQEGHHRSPLLSSGEGEGCAQRAALAPAFHITRDRLAFWPQMMVTSILSLLLLWEEVVQGHCPSIPRLLLSCQDGVRALSPPATPGR